MDNKWIIQHAKTGSITYLQIGDNVIGRNSTCSIRMRYAYLSRQHANLHVSSDDIVTVRLMCAMNGVFVNNKQVTENCPLREGDIIGLGVEATVENATFNYGIFILKKEANILDPVIVISDDEDELPMGQSHLESKEPVLDNDGAIKTKMTENVPSISANDARNKDIIELINDEIASAPSADEANRILHMPKLPEVKEEIVMQATAEIYDIFGDADEVILDSMLDINPYVFNKLRKTHAQTSGKICDGDVIELDEETQVVNTSTPSTTKEIGLNDYDENFAMSQAVLQEMKDEMLSDEQTEDENEEETKENADFAKDQIKSEFPTTFDEDEVIIIDDDDDDLHNKVADWSSKLLSQNQLCQAYPLSNEEIESDEYENARQNVPESPVLLKMRSKLQRIVTSDSEHEIDTREYFTSNNIENVPESPELFTRRSKMQHICSSSSEDDGPARAQPKLREMSETTIDPLEGRESSQPRTSTSTKKSSSTIRNRNKSVAALTENVSSISANVARNKDNIELINDEVSSAPSDDNTSDAHPDTNNLMDTGEYFTSNNIENVPESPELFTRRSTMQRICSSSSEDDNPVRAEPKLRRCKVVIEACKMPTTSIGPLEGRESSHQPRTSTSTKRSSSTMRNRSKSVAARTELVFNNRTVSKTKTLQNRDQYSNNQNNEPATGRTIRTRSKSLADRSQLMLDEPTIPKPEFLNVDEQSTGKLNELVTKRLMRMRSKSVAARVELELDEPTVYKSVSLRKQSSHKKEQSKAATNDQSSSKTKKRMRSRSKSVAARTELELDDASDYKSVSLREPEPPNHKTEKSKAASNNQSSSKADQKIRARSKSVAARSELDLNQIFDAEIPEIIAEKPPEVSKSRLLQRSMSLCIERAAPAEHVSTAQKSERGPAIIEAPHLPQNKGKLRGVSAVSIERERKPAVLERLNAANRLADMKAKWLSKPSTKNQESAKIREIRREQLKKLAEKNLRESANVSEGARVPKRRMSTVKVVGNSNRGAFLTEGIGPPEKVLKLTEAAEPTPQPAKRTERRATTVDSHSQHIVSADEVQTPPTHYSRPPERREAFEARCRRTLNRITFADMERDFKLRQEQKKSFKKVRFSDKVEIRYIERIEGATSKVEQRKDTNKMTLSTYKERREWMLGRSKTQNFNEQIRGSILRWGNQWLRVGSADAVADSEMLMPIPHEFRNFGHYKDTIIPLMKLELLTTIERSYKIGADTFICQLKRYNIEGDRFILTTTYECRHWKKFDLYTVTYGNIETFAYITKTQRHGESTILEITFQIMQNNLFVHYLHAAKTLTVRPVVDNLRVEMGAFNAVYQMTRTPLFRKILKPSENTAISLNSNQSAYKGFAKLSPEQVDICMRTYHRLMDDVTPSITLIQGPPGTGKSHVITNLSLQCLYGTAAHMCDRKVLICAHSNTAVDNVANSLRTARNRMNHHRFRLLRFGLYERMCRKARLVSLQHYLERDRRAKCKRLTAENTENLLQQQQQLEKEIAEMRAFKVQGTSLVQQLANKERQMRQLHELLDPPLTPREEHTLSEKYLKEANIVCTTLSSCVKLASFVDYFDICIIDEATQCTEPWTLLPLGFGVRGLVLVGDTQQLPATVLSQKAVDFGLANSMFDRIQRNLLKPSEKPGTNSMHTNVYKLSTQYRMHPEICQWPNKFFYDNQLLNAPSTEKLTAPIMPYCVINLSYTHDENDAISRSIRNDEEAHFVSDLLVEMDKLMPTNKYHYGVITPYTNHCDALRRSIPSHLNVIPCTVGAYQGLQTDVVILSNARTRGVGFLTSYQRLNVALTRPRRCLIICGNFQDIETHEMWRDLLDDARSRKRYINLERRVQNMDEVINQMIQK